ncbi:hypothetical protein BT69DRAFT_1208216, partial [Atractiella rhizophila]
CKECDGSLVCGSVPKFALRNELYHGCLPDDLQDLTWIEERACARFRSSASVVRVYLTGDKRTNGLKFHGNICAHCQNIQSTARKLPLTESDLLNEITVVLVGVKEPTENMLKNAWRCRRHKIARFLIFLKENHRLYHDFDMDVEALARLAAYPEDG